MAPHEASVLCTEVTSPSHTRSARQLVGETCRKQESGRLLLLRLRNQLDSSVAAMKCSMTSNAAAEASL